MNKIYLNDRFFDACNSGDLGKVRHYLTSPGLKERADIHADNGYGFQVGLSIWTP